MITSQQLRILAGTSTNRKLTTVLPGGCRGRVGMTVQVPHQQLGVEIFVADPTDPAHSPGPEMLDDGVLAPHLLQSTREAT